MRLMPILGTHCTGLAMSIRDLMQSHKRPQGMTRFGGLLLAATLLLGAGASIAQSADGQDTAGKPRRGAKQCSECHETYFAIADTKHLVQNDARTPKARGEECMACHGDTSEHNRTPRVKGLVPVTFGRKAPQGPQTEVCLNCHQNGKVLMWEGSTHERTQQVCGDCHKVHSTKDPVVVAETQAGVCFECHKDRRADILKSSTHPIKSGFLPCSSCHNPHGSTSRALMTKDSVNNTCATCHAEKRGPYLWEHPVAKDDCTNCHNPHGTNNAAMLKVRPPFLCQQCHQTSSHSSAIYSGENLANLQNIPRTGADSTPGSQMSGQRLMGRSCANCHTKIHGSNHPSGSRFLR